MIRKNPQKKWKKEKIKIKFFGDLTALSPKLRELAAETERISEKFEGVQVNLCVNYGARDEILRAVRAYAEEYKRSGKAVNEESFSDYLYSMGLPDPDLIIRPSGEQRLSNFLLWQAAYSELYFTDVLWPDFSRKDMDMALLAYQKRDRRYGGVK